MTQENNPQATESDAQNLSTIANMIDLSTETLCRVSPDYIEVGND